MRRLFPFSLLLYMILLSGCTTAPLESKQSIEIIPIQVEKVKKNTFSETLTLSGVTRAKQEFPILTTTPMLVEEVYTKLGQKVNQGDQLIRFANPELDTQLSVVQQQVQLLNQALNQLEHTDQEAQVDGEQLSKQYREALDRAFELNLSELLAYIRQINKEVPIYILDLYSPYGTGHPLHQASQEVITSFNNQLNKMVTAQEKTYLVSVHSFFLNRELSLTHISMNDIHPNDQGYKIIFDAFKQNIVQ